MSKITSATVKNYLFNGIKKTGAIPMKNVTITVQPVGAFANSNSTPTIINNSGFLANAKNLEWKLGIKVTGADMVLPQQAFAQDYGAMCADQMAQIKAEMGNIQNEIEDMFNSAACQMWSIGILILTLLGCNGCGGNKPTQSSNAYNPADPNSNKWQTHDMDHDWDDNGSDPDVDGDGIPNESDSTPNWPGSEENKDKDDDEDFRYPPYLEDAFSTVNKNELQDLLVEFQVFVNEGSDKAEFLVVNFNNAKSYAFKFRW